MTEHERRLLSELRARLGGAAAARASACEKCAELLRTKQGSHSFLVEVRLASSRCPPQRDVIVEATTALRAVEGRDLTPETIAKLVAAARSIHSESSPDQREYAMLELWVRRSEVFSESLSSLFLKRWELLRRGESDARPR